MIRVAGQRLGLAADGAVRDIARACAQAGGRVLVVGGWVRDGLLGAEPGGADRPERRDMDLEVYGLRPEVAEAVLARFGGVRRVGRSFPVFLVAGLGLDVSLPRRERSRPSDARVDWLAASRPESVRAAVEADSNREVWADFDPEQSFEQASLGRDLRVNSMAWDPLTEELLDPHGGQADLSARRLRATCPRRFGEDPLRGLRTAQLTARLELAPDAELRGLCAAVDLSKLPGERLLEEFRKFLLRARCPARALSLLCETGLLRFFPELEVLRGVPQDSSWHPEGDVWTHTLRVVDEAARERIGDATEDQALMFGALCHDLGKPATTEERGGRVVARDHSRAGVAPAEALLARLRAPKALIAAVSALVRNHRVPAEFVKWPQRAAGRVDAGPRAYRRLARGLREHAVSFELLVRLARADYLGRSTQTPAERVFPAGELFLERARAIEAQAPAHVDVVKGRHVLACGFEPGPAVGKLLVRCRTIQDDTGWSDPGRILAQAVSDWPRTSEEKLEERSEGRTEERSEPKSGQ